MTYRISSILLGTLIAATAFLVLQEVASAQLIRRQPVSPIQQTVPRQLGTGQWGTGQWGQNLVRPEQPQPPTRSDVPANSQQGMFDWTRQVAGQVDRNTPAGYFQGERQSSRNAAPREQANTSVARFSSQVSQAPRNTWQSQIADNNDIQSASIEMNVEGERMRVQSYVKPPQPQQQQQPSGPAPLRAMPEGSFAEARALNAGIAIGPLRWTNTGITSDQRRFLNDVRNAQRNWGLPVYSSSRLRIQYIEGVDDFGNSVPWVVYVHPTSPLRGRVAIMDIICEIDGDPISSPWDLELHYRWTEIEKVRWQDGRYRVFWVWLGMF